MSTSSPTLEDRLRRLEDKQALHDLAHLYGFVMDERDLEGLSSLFTEDARLGSEDGVFDARDYVIWRSSDAAERRGDARRATRRRRSRPICARRSTA